MNGSFITDTIKVLGAREKYARAELRDDQPLLVLPLKYSVILASLTDLGVLQRFIILVNHPCSLVVLGGRGNRSDLALMQDELREQIAHFTKAVSEQDVSGKLVADTISEILREHFLEKSKPLAVQLVVVDYNDPQRPVSVFSFNGEVNAGNGFILNGADISRLKKTFASSEEAKEYAQKILGRKKGFRRQTIEVGITPKDKILFIKF